MTKKCKIGIGLATAVVACGLVGTGYYAYSGGFDKPSIVVSEEQAPENAGELSYDFTVLSSSISQALSDFGVEVGVESTEGSITCKNMDVGEEYKVTLLVDVVGDNENYRVTLSQNRKIKSEGDEFKIKYSVVLPNGLELENLHFTAEEVK